MTNSIAPLIDRLDAAETRLAALSQVPFPPGRTDPDPGGEETWDASRVWAHVGEFVRFWTAQARAIVASPAGSVPRFGRLADDPERISTIERDHALPREVLAGQVFVAIAEARTWFGSLTDAELDREGLHPTRGNVTVRFILETFVVKHVEEHAGQLDKLAAAAASGDVPAAPEPEPPSP